MIEKQLINLLLEKDFYEDNKGPVSKSMFTYGTGKLYETITKAHSDSESNISIDELATLHTQVYNPALTRAAKDNFYSLLEEVKKEKIEEKGEYHISEDAFKNPEKKGFFYGYEANLIGELEKKYGRVSVNINDGTIKAEENGSIDKKN